MKPTGGTASRENAASTTTPPPRAKAGLLTTRARVISLAVISVLVIGGAAAYFAYARSSADAQMANAPAVAQTSDLQALLDQDHVVFRSTALGDSYGKLAVVSLADPSGNRAVLDSSCERVYATAVNGVCITADRGIVPKYGITELNGTLAPQNSSDLTGLPSRARISPDGSLISTTTFVTGHSYAESTFSTATVLRRDTGEEIGNLEDFTATVDGQPFTAVDRNFWGVTFVDDDTFYVTGASTSMGKTWLMKGSIAERTLTSIRTDAECPSVSPDRTRVAYKTREGALAPGQWRIAVYDLASGVQTILPGDRSVDDQVEWLNNATVLYALPREGTEATTTDIWQVSADGTGSPQVFIPQASSPAVVLP